MCPGSRPGVGQPEAHVLQNSSDRLAILNEADQLQSALTAGTDQGVCLVNLLDKARQIFSRLCSGEFRFQDSGDGLDVFSITASAPYAV